MATPRWILVLLVALLALPACSSPSVRVPLEAGVKLEGGPSRDPGMVGASVKGPTIDVGPGAVAAPGGASWPAGHAPAASPTPVAAAPGPPVSMAAPESDPCPGGVCLIPPSGDGSSTEPSKPEDPPAPPARVETGGGVNPLLAGAVVLGVVGLAFAAWRMGRVEDAPAPLVAKAAAPKPDPSKEA